MKILVINTGSSSIKYELFDMDKMKKMAAGVAEKIGEETSMLTHKKIQEDGEILEKVEEGAIEDHAAGLQRVVQLLLDPEYGAVQDKSEISAVGHRVVHGGESFKEPTIINDEVLSTIKEFIPLAPLHNPPNLKGIEVAMSIFPDAPQVAVFDTAFHQSIPKKAFLYPLPYDLYKNNRVRRYGFHGTSHAYVTEKAAEYLNKPLSETNIITIHIGNGASMAAVKNGKCVDTTMGLTPLEGLVMGTRCGDIDPAIPFFLADNLNMTLKDIDKLLNKESGLKGMCGINDMREVIKMSKEGDEQATIALHVYTYRIKKYIGAYYAAIGDLDAIIFTAGIGEKAHTIRKHSCSDLQKLGIEIDHEKNETEATGIREISTQESKIKVLVIPTNEELRIALQSKKVLG